MEALIDKALGAVADADHRDTGLALEFVRRIFIKSGQDHIRLKLDDLLCISVILPTASSGACTWQFF